MVMNPKPRTDLLVFQACGPPALRFPALNCSRRITQASNNKTPYRNPARGFYVVSTYIRPNANPLSRESRGVEPIRTAHPLALTISPSEIVGVFRIGGFKYRLFGFGFRNVEMLDQLSAPGDGPHHPLKRGHGQLAPFFLRSMANYPLLPR